MKLSKLTLVALGSVLSMSAHSASLSVNNFGSIAGGPNPALPFTDNAGNALTSGFIALYTFAGGAPSDAASLQAVGDTGNLNLIPFTAGNAPSAGAFTGSFTANNAGNVLNGQSLFIVIGDGTSVADSTSLAMISTGTSFTIPDAPPPGDVQSYRIDTTSNVLIGTVGNVTVDWTNLGQPSLTGSGLQLAVVPEASSSLLLGLAGLTLLIRRRRR